MGIIDTANRLIAQITGNQDGFGIAMVLTAPNGQVANITGLHTKIHLSVDTEGNAINTKQGRVSFSESNLLAASPNYPIRNATGEVDLENHLIDVADSTGGIKHYTAQSWMPDETIGLIVAYLSDYE